MSTLRAAKNLRCSLCRDPILRGDEVVLHSDAYIHLECEPAPFERNEMQEIATAWADWKALAYEHDNYHHGMDMDELEGAMTGALIGREIAKAANMDSTDEVLVSNLGFGFMCGLAVQKFRGR